MPKTIYMNRKYYLKPQMRSVELNMESALLLASNFIEGGEDGETGDADTQKKRPISSENWESSRDNYWQ